MHASPGAAPFVLTLHVHRLEIKGFVQGGVYGSDVAREARHGGVDKEDGETWDLGEGFAFG